MEQVWSLPHITKCRPLLQVIFKGIQYMYMCLGPLSVVGYCLRVTTCNTRLLYKGAHARKEAELLDSKPNLHRVGDLLVTIHCPGKGLKNIVHTL